MCKGGGRRPDHRTRYLGRAADDCAQADSREHEHVIGLADAASLAADIDRGERAARRHQRLAVGPRHNVRGRSLADIRRVGERQYYRVVRVPRGVAYDLFRETAGPPGRADQYVALEGVDDFCEVAAVLASQPDLIEPFGGPCEIALVLVEITAVFADNAAAVERNDRAPEFLAIDTFLLQLPADLPGDAYACCAGAVDNGSAVAEFFATDSCGRMQARSRNRACALYIVVERRQMVAMPVEHLERDVLVEILPLDHDVREYLAGGFHELVHDGEICIAPQAVLSPA